MFDFQLADACTVLLLVRVLIVLLVFLLLLPILFPLLLLYMHCGAYLTIWKWKWSLQHEPARPFVCIAMHIET